MDLRVFGLWWRPLSAILLDNHKTVEFKNLRSSNHLADFLVEIDIKNRDELIEKYDIVLRYFKENNYRRTFGMMNYISNLYSFCDKEELGRY
jgi:hypothetical protein